MTENIASQNGNDIFTWTCLMCSKQFHIPLDGISSSEYCIQCEVCFGPECRKECECSYFEVSEEETTDGE